jgi:hypothetical protein
MCNPSHSPHTHTEFILTDLQAGKGGGAPVDVLVLPPGEALPVLHAMRYTKSLEDGTSPLHFKPDGSPQDKQPTGNEIREEVGLACKPLMVFAVI